MFPSSCFVYTAQFFQAHPASLTTPRTVVDFDDATASYKLSEIESLITGADAWDTEVFVLSITGVFRGGKSFLLGLFQTYLDYICKVGGNI